MKKKIIFNYLPPAYKNIPSSAFSILKSFLHQNNYKSNIIYWNILLDNRLGKQNNNVELMYIDLISLLPFLYILAEEHNDKKIIDRIINFLNKLNIDNIIAEDLLNEKNYSRKNIIELKNIILKRISSELDKIDFDKILFWGISAKFFQWVPGIILAKEIKKRNPDAKIVAGGFGCKNEAFEVLNSGSDFDYAIYGEGEYPLLNLCEFLEKEKPSLKNIPRLIYRENNILKISETSKSEFLNFEEYIFPDYSDYFDYTKNTARTPFYPINYIRSCQWRKCKFCTFISGSRYRERNPESVIREIKFLFEKYKTINVYFLDNDIIGNDIRKFEYLLDLLIKLNQKHNMKYNFWAEIILQNDLNSRLYKKMKLAGFKKIFGGFEAVSDSLLKKMDKINSFADNILYLKFSMKFKLYNRGNVIKNIPEETIKEIKESRKNLHFLRFFLNKQHHEFILNYSQFTLYKDSRYNKLLSKKEKQEYIPGNYFNFFPKQFINKPFNLFGYMKEESLEIKNEWEIFKQVENYYRKNEFTYEILGDEDNIYYLEYLNKEVCNSLIFDKLDHAVLCAANNKVVSLEDIHMNMQKHFSNITKNKVIEILSNLKKQYLIYYNEDYSNIVSIIDTDIIN